MTVGIALLDHLGVIPIVARLLVTGWTTPTTVGWHLSLDFEQSLTVSAPTVGHQRWWGMVMRLASFDLLPQVHRRLRFILTYTPSTP